jgi:hypothetical protein
MKGKTSLLLLVLLLTAPLALYVFGQGIADKQQHSGVFSLDARILKLETRISELERRINCLEHPSPKIVPVKR